MAALMAWKETVAKAMKLATNVVMANTRRQIDVWLAKFCSHLLYPPCLPTNNTAGPLDHDILQHRLSVQHANDAMAVTGIVFGVGYHDNGCALFVQVSEQLHHFITVG